MNCIAGIYDGIDAVFGYFERRRDLAGRTLRKTRRDLARLTGLSRRPHRPGRKG